MSAYVDPRFHDEASGTSGDDHPHADIRVGQSFLSPIYDAVTIGTGLEQHGARHQLTTSGAASSTTCLRPSRRDANPNCRLRGFRVPTFVDFAVRAASSRRAPEYDHTSILKMIEWRWALSPLTIRDAHARNLAEVLHFAKPNLHAPTWSVPPTVGTPCSTPDPSEFADWRALVDQATAAGFDVPV